MRIRKYINDMRVKIIIFVLWLSMLFAANQGAYAGNSVTNETTSDNSISENLILPEIQGLEADSSEFIKGYSGSVEIKVKVKPGSNLLDKNAYAMQGPFETADSKYSDADFDYLSVNTFKIKENGYYLFAVRDEKKNINTCLTHITCIDREAPVVSGINMELENGVNGYAKSAVISIAAYDTKSRLAEKAFSFDDGESYTANCRLKIKDNGIYVIRVRDGVGNVTRKRVEINQIDNQPPTLVVTCDQDSCMDSTIVNLSMVDTKAGLNKLWYMKQGDDTEYVQQELDGILNAEENIEIAENGKYTFFITDCLGNVSLSEVEFKFLGSDSEKKNVTATKEASTEIIKRKSSSSKSRKNSTSAKTIVIGDSNSTEISEKYEEKRIVIKSKESDSEKNLEQVSNHKELKLSNDEGIEDEEYEEEIDEGAYDEITDTEPSAFYGLDAGVEHSQVEMEDYFAAPKMEDTVSAPSIKRTMRKVEEISKGKIALAAISIIFTLFAVTLFILNKKGIIDVKAIIEKFKPETEDEENEQEEEEE